MKHFTYLIVLLFTISYPLYKSFEDKIMFHKKWRALFPAILISAILFIAWDVWFTHLDIWHFNEDYYLGFTMLGLPLEEWLFFFIVPYSCVFIYEVVNYFMKEELSDRFIKTVTLSLVTLLLLVSAFNLDKFYTCFTFLSLAAALLIHQFFLRSDYFGKFYSGWAVCMIPFLIVNGTLTATVFIYNNLENLNFRIYSIPVEDPFYGMLQFLVVISLYEYFKRKLL